MMILFVPFTEVHVYMLPVCGDILQPDQPDRQGPNTGVHSHHAGRCPAGIEI